VKEIRNHNEN